MGGYSIPQTAIEAGDGSIDPGTNARIGMPGPGSAPRSPMPPAESDDGIPLAGMIPVALGLPSVVRIPIPGTNGLAIELKPRGWVPKNGTTSTLFFQDASGKRHLRLDYGYNKNTNSINYHWNQKGTGQQFGIQNHTPAGPGGGVAYKAAKYFRHAGRLLLVAGVLIEAVEIVESDRPLRRASQAVAGWAGAWAGCKVVGGGGAALGMLASPLGSAAGGILGCVIGGAGGYYGGSVAAGIVYDWAEGTRFTPLVEEPAP